MQTFQHKPRQAYKCLSLLAMLYILLQIYLQLLVKKIIHLPWFGDLPLSIFFTGIFFILSDLITEVYGYKESQKIFLSMIIVSAIYCVSMQFLAHTPSPTFTVDWATTQDQSAYRYLFGNAIQFYLGVTASYIFGVYLNMYLISKWKILLKGRYFWLRSIGASSIGAFIITIISTVVVGWQTIVDDHAFQLILKIILASFLIKIVTLILLAYPATLICTILKKVEGVDVYDYGINYNPFKDLTSHAKD